MTLQDIFRENPGPRTLTVIIEHLPCRELSPNFRCHFMVKAHAVRTAREEAGWLAKAQWHDQQPMMKAQITYRFSVSNHRRRDLDNLIASCKPFQDGLVDAGVLFYDDAAHLSMGLCSLTTDIKDETLIEVVEII